MGGWSTTRKLRRASDRLRRLRDDLRVLDEQRQYVVDDADDLGLRAIVSDAPIDRHDAREAAGHAEALLRQRRHLVAEIARLEALQDRLLDRLGGG